MSEAKPSEYLGDALRYLAGLRLLLEAERATQDPAELEVRRQAIEHELRRIEGNVGHVLHVIRFDPC